MARRDRMRANQERLKAEPAFLPTGEIGEHCSYCPSARYCPAQMSLVRAVLAGESEEVRTIAKVGSSALEELGAARLHAMVSQAEDRLRELKEALKNFARVTPFQLPSGKWYGVPPDATERELSEDGRLVQQAVAEVLDEEAAKVCTKVEASFSRIESAVRAYVAKHPEIDKRGVLKELNEKIAEKLKERALLRTVVGGQVRVHVRK
jgi:hypothetical protein